MVHISSANPEVEKNSTTLEICVFLNSIVVARIYLDNHGDFNSIILAHL